MTLDAKIQPGQLLYQRTLSSPTRDTRILSQELGQDLGRASGDERDQPDVAAAVRALERKLLPDPRHQLGPGNP